LAWCRTKPLHITKPRYTAKHLNCWRATSPLSGAELLGASAGAHAADYGEAGTQFTRFTSTEVQILTPEELQVEYDSRQTLQQQFTCFTSTKVQILTLEELQVEYDSRQALQQDAVRQVF